MLDMLRFLTFSQNATKHLEPAAYDLIKPIDPASGYGKRIRIKSIATDGPGKGKGDTWDISLYDESFVYDWITELAFHTPRDYKKFIGNHSGNKNPDGVTMYSRFVSESMNHSVIKTPSVKSTYRTFKDCKQVDEQKLGDITHILDGPFLIDHAGDVGLVQTMIHSYFWGITCEQNFLALDFGLVRWILKHQNSNTGLYDFVKQSVHNNVNTGGSPDYYFPCF
jgi:hypothetical protein